MTTKNVSVRLSSDGAGKVKADLVGLAESGSASLTRLANTASLAVKAFIAFQGGRLIKEAIGGVVGYARDAIDFAGRLAETADELGVSVESLQRYQYAASQVGVENEKLQKAFQKLGLRIGEALAGDQNAAKIFDRLNVSLLDTQGLTRGTEAVFRDVVDTIAAMKSPTEQQAALAATLGDRLGPKMLNLVRQGTTGLDEFGGEAERLGLILGEDVTRNADDVGDAISSLVGVIGTAGRTIVYDLMPSAEAIQAFTRDVAAFFEEAIDGFRRFFGLKPDFDDTLDQIEEKAREILARKTEIAEREHEIERIRREQPGGLLAATQDLQKQQNALAALEAQMKGLRDRYAEILNEQAKFRAGPPPGAGLRPGEGEADAEREVKALQQVVEALDAEVAARRRRDETLATLQRNREQLGEERYLDLVARAQKQYADSIAGLPGGIKEMEDAERKRASTLAALHAQLDPVAAANDRFAETMRKIEESGVEGEARLRLMSAAVLDWGEALDEATGKSKAAADAKREHDRLLAEGTQIYRETRTAAEAYDIEMERLTDLYRVGAIDADTLHRAVEKLGEALDDGDDKIKELTRAFEGFGRRSARAIGDVLLGLDETNDSVGRLLQTLGSDLLEQLLYKNITGPLADASSRLFRSSGDSGIFSFIGSLFGFAEGGVFESGHLKAFARGGVVTQPAIFPMADGLGLMGEEGPEAVLPLTRLRNGRLGVEATSSEPKVSITVLDQRGANAPPVQVRQRRGADGRREIEIVVRDLVDKLIGEGRFDRTMQGNFGLSRAPVMRS